MNYLKETEALSLIKDANDAANMSYSPYSLFKVGAALLTQNGNIYKGTNIENISYTGTVHAEKVAVGLARMANDNEFKAIAVYANSETISPCGDCRQFLLEFNPKIIIIFMYKGKLIQRTVSELLPFQFDDITN